MTSGMTGSTSTYGYVALPDNTGQCPKGLVEARPWMAQPKSIYQGSINGRNPPSSFDNQNGRRNNTIFSVEEPRPFEVLRQPSQYTCDSLGDCTNAEFGWKEQVESVEYMPLTPIICVIPKNRILGQ
jgi:hypothetical protein